ncbi:MAG: tetratricopeptide repeat protein [Gammaproteobacteria bacterium]|nr:tetratricopeptide repeat protein [Gammaproteobacteria bacterium]
MSYFLKSILQFLTLLLICYQAYGAECNTSDLPEDIHKLVEQDKMDEAVKLAKQAYEKNINNKIAALYLARVYINATLTSVVNFDMSQLGFQTGESGSREITMDMLKKATASRTAVNPDYLDNTNKFIHDLVRRWPEEKNLYYCLTKIHFYSGNHDEFLNQLAQTASLFKNNEQEAVNYLIDYGTELMQSDNYDFAAEVYQALLKIFPESVPLLSSLGVSYIKQGFTRKAMAYFEHAYKNDRSDVIVLGNLSETAMLLGEFEKAEKFLLKRADFEPDKAEIYFDLAINNMHLRPGAGNDYWAKYFSIHARHPDDEQWAKNARVIQQAANNSDITISDWHQLAIQMIESGVPKYAIPLLHYVNKTQLQDPSVSYSRAYAYDAGKHYDLQKSALEETLKRIKQSDNKTQIDIDQVYYNLSRSTYMLGQYDQALNYLSSVSGEMKNSANIDYMYGMVYRDRGDRKKADSYFNSCLKKANGASIENFCRDQLK